MLTPEILNFALFLATGAMVGLLAGLLGVGGGLIVVPILLYLLPHLGIDSSQITHMAVATSLATIVITSIASVKAHNRHGTVIWWVFRAMTPGIVLGGIIGSTAARYIDSDNLKTVFGIFALLIAVQMIFKFRPPEKSREPGKLRLFFSGGIIGSFSTLVGIGGGSLTVPYLIFWKTNMARAVGTSSAIGLPLSISGTIGFIISGWGAPELPHWSLGYVFLPAFFGIVMVSSFTAPIGARLASKISGKLLSRVFASFLIVVGLDILLTL